MKRASAATVYATVYPFLQEVARAHGYALALHGSMVRDMDVVAVPWHTECSEPDTLAKAMQDALGHYCGKSGKEYTWGEIPRDTKPHNRTAYTLRFGSNDPLFWVDLSVVQPTPSAAFVLDTMVKDTVKSMMVNTVANMSAAVGVPVAGEMTAAEYTNALEDAVRAYVADWDAQVRDEKAACFGCEDPDHIAAFRRVLASRVRKDDAKGGE